MNELILKISVIVFLCIAFFMMSYLGTGTDQKNLMSLRSYPDVVIEKVNENPTLSKLAPKQKPIWLVMVVNLVVFFIVFVFIGIIIRYVVGFKSYLDTFIYLLILGETLNLFDLVVIDLLWWRNSSRIRFSFLQDKTYYQDPKKHLLSFLRGVIVFGLDAALASLIVLITL